MFSFKKEQRLLKKSQFNAVFEHAKKITTSDFVFLYRKNHMHFARIGFAISKKAMPHACHRNQIRRLIREKFRLETSLAPIDIVVLVRQGSNLQDKKNRLQSLALIWKKILQIDG